MIIIIQLYKSFSLFIRTVLHSLVSWSAGTYIFVTTERKCFVGTKIRREIAFASLGAFSNEGEEDHAGWIECHSTCTVKSPLENRKLFEVQFLD